MLSTFKMVKFLCRCEPKIATIEFGHFVGFCIDNQENFIKIRGSKLCLSHKFVEMIKLLDFISPQY